MKRPWPPPFFGLSFVQGCYAVYLTWTDTNDTCGCPPCLRKPPRTSAQTTYPDASHNRDNASNIVISPAGKHSASGEARYSVTFKETETDSPAIGIRGLPADAAVAAERGQRAGTHEPAAPAPRGCAADGRPCADAAGRGQWRPDAARLGRHERHRVPQPVL